jgi:hypothetical protein
MTGLSAAIHAALARLHTSRINTSRLTRQCAKTACALIFVNSQFSRKWKPLEHRSSVDSDRPWIRETRTACLGAKWMRNLREVGQFNDSEDDSSSLRVWRTVNLNFRDTRDWLKSEVRGRRFVDRGREKERERLAAGIQSAINWKFHPRRVAP